MRFLKRFMPFLLSLGGVLLDYLTTVIGLSLGFYETNPAYHPFKALLVFWGILAGLTLLLPKEKVWTLSINGVALLSYLGAVNNILLFSRLYS